MQFTHYVAGILLAGALSFSASAHEGHDHEDGGTPPPHREPPAQAYEDCKGKSEGDKLEIITPRGDKVPATCTQSPKGLFARPDHPPKDRGGKEGGKGGDENMPPPKSHGGEGMKAPPEGGGKPPLSEPGRPEGL